MLAWVFQDGHFEGLLGFHSNGGIVAWLPMFLFVILFGLSMDYHVFILSRVREAVDRGMRTEDAVAHGIRATAGTVTSAAVVMVAVFAIFATLSALDFKQMGVGLSVADPARRHDRPGRAPAGHDEALGRLELVPAQAPGLAADAQPRGGSPRAGPGAGARPGVGRSQARGGRSRPPRPLPGRARPRFGGGRNPDQFGRCLLGFPKSWRPETSSSAVATPATAGVA